MKTTIAILAIACSAFAGYSAHAADANANDHQKKIQKDDDSDSSDDDSSAEASPKPKASGSVVANGISCPFLANDPTKDVNAHLNALMDILNKNSKGADCDQAKADLAEIQSRVDQTAIAAGTQGSTPQDPSQKLAQLDIAEKMSSTMGSKCLSSLKDPKPLIYSSLFFAGSMANSPLGLYGTGAAIDLLGDVGERIAKLFQHPTALQKARNAADKQQGFLDNLCMLYVYEHEVDSTLAKLRKLGPQMKADQNKRAERLKEIETQLAQFKGCEPEQQDDPAKKQVETLQSTVSKISKDADAVASCNDITGSLIKRSSPGYSTVEELSGRSCDGMDDSSCQFAADADFSDSTVFCRNWCMMKKQVNANFSCEDFAGGDEGKAKLAQLKARAQSVLEFAVKKAPTSTVDNSIVNKFKSLEGEQSKLKALSADAEKQTLAAQSASTHFSEPIIRTKSRALSKTVLDDQFKKYSEQLYDMNKKELKELKDLLKKSEKRAKKGDEGELCIDVRAAQARLTEIDDRFSHAQDICHYLGNQDGDKSIPAFTDASLSFWDSSSQLRSFCYERSNEREHVLDAKDEHKISNKIDELNSKYECKALVGSTNP